MKYSFSFEIGHKHQQQGKVLALTIKMKPVVQLVRTLTKRVRNQLRAIRLLVPSRCQQVLSLETIGINKGHGINLLYDNLLTHYFLDVTKHCYKSKCC